tara:strand:+ start:117 stop:410 length:294 start_codon:yes stop_codon:yes gene_type:complete
MITDSLNMSKDFSVGIKTIDNRGFTPEEVAKRCADKIISISDTAHPAIQEQAREYKNNLEQIIAHYMKEAIKSDRTTVYNAIKDSGNIKLAEYIRRL